MTQPTDAATSVGAIHFDQPRAVKVRNPNDLNDVHSAVYSGLAIYVNSKTEADAIMNAWKTIMDVTALQVQNILDEVRGQTG